MDKIIKTEVVDSIEFEDKNVLITDPCYVMEDYRSKIAKPHGILEDTLYGDWSCTVFKASDYKECYNNSVVGEFCADAGLVCIIDLEYARANSNKPYGIDHWLEEHYWCGTIIDDFTGRFDVVDVTYEHERDGEPKQYTGREIYGYDKDNNRIYIAYQTGL